MVTFATPSSPQPLPFLIEPFRQGYYNLRDVYQGERVESVASGAFAPPIDRYTPMSLMERVTAVFVGLLLMVPLIQRDCPCYSKKS